MSKKQKAALAATGIAGASLVAWKAFFPWVGDDIKTIRAISKALKMIGKNIMEGRTGLKMLEENVARFPKKTFIIFEDRHFSYEYVDAMANKVANLAMTWGLPLHTPVAMMIENEPAFLWTFFGEIFSSNGVFADVLQCESVLTPRNEQFALIRI